jgi:thioredoxin reductase (NADPH)
VILATGIEDIQPKISNLTELRKSGLLRYCPICDGYEFREKKIAVLVQDMRGLRSSLFISDYARCLELAIPAELKIPEALKRELLTRRVRFHYGALIAIARSHSPGGLRIELQGCKAFHCDVAYVELGARLRDEAFRTIQGLRLSKNMRIMTDSHQESSVQGLYAIGDCVESLAQISVAAAQGAIAATAVHNRLRNQLLGLQAK